MKRNIYSTIFVSNQSDFSQKTGFYHKGYLFWERFRRNLLYEEDNFYHTRRDSTQKYFTLHLFLVFDESDYLSVH